MEYYYVRYTLNIVCQLYRKSIILSDIHLIYCVSYADRVQFFRYILSIVSQLYIYGVQFVRYILSIVCQIYQIKYSVSAVDMGSHSQHISPPCMHNCCQVQCSMLPNCCLAQLGQPNTEMTGRKEFPVLFCCRTTLQTSPKRKGIHCNLKIFEVLVGV